MVVECVIAVVPHPKVRKIMNQARTIILLVLCGIFSPALNFIPQSSVLGAPQQLLTTPQQPLFEDYPATSVFKGKVAALNIANNIEARDYEKEIRDRMQQGTNFAGHYVIADNLNRAMGGRDSAAIVDLKTGNVYLPKQLIGYHDQRGAGYTVPRPDGGLHYRANSNLLIIVGRAAGSDGDKGVGKYYYKWENNQLKFLQFVASPYNSQ